LDALAKDASLLRRQSASYEGRVESAPARGPEYDALMRDYQNTRDIYDQLMKKYGDARLVENAERHRVGDEFHVLDAALPPPLPAGPNRAMLLMFGLLLALIGTVVAVLVADRLVTFMHSID